MILRAPFIACLALAFSLSACAGIGGEKGVSSGASASSTYGNYLSARLAASEHDMHDAARLYRASLKNDPQNANLLNRAFLYTVASGEIDDGKAIATRVIAVSPDNRAARLTLAVLAIKGGDYATAREHISKSAKGPFTQLTLSLLEAWVADAQGDMPTALKDLKAVPNEGGSQALADYHRALMLDLGGKIDEADVAYRTALAQIGPNPRMVDAYGRFLERNGRSADAKTLYEKLVNNSSIEPIAKAGLARIAAGNVPDRLVRNVQQGAAESLFGIASSLTDKGSAEVALLYLRLALYLRPDFDTAKIVLADRFEALEKYHDAIEIYDSVDHDSPYSVSAQVQAAVDMGRLKETDKSIATLRAVVKEHPDTLEGWTALGDAYRSAERWDEAAKAYDGALKALPKVEKTDWPLFYARAVSYERANHWPQAEADLLHALKLNPNQPQVLNYLGYSWVEQRKNLPKAMAMLEKARALSPYDGYIVDSVGWAYYQLGRYTDAVDTLQIAVLLVPGDSTINDHLGDAYWQIGKKRDARFQWNHALAFDPSAEEKPRIERKLQVGLPEAHATAENGK